MIKKIAAGLLSLSILAGVLAFAGQSTVRLRVQVELASIRDAPDNQGRILGYLKQGTEITSGGKSGAWYVFNFLSPDGRTNLTGYVFEAAVEVLGAAFPPAAAGTPSAAPSSPAPSGDKSLDELLRLEENIRQESIAFLSLIKKMQPQESGQGRTRTVERVRVAADGAPVYDRMDASSIAISRARLNEEFDVIEKGDRFFKIALKDGRQGWLEESSVQAFTASKTESKIQFAGIATTEVKSFLDTAAELYGKIVKEKTEADLVLKGYTGGDPARDASAAKIRKYVDYASQFYRQFIEGKEADLGTAASFLSRISAWTELLFGSSNFGTTFLNDSKEEFKGMIRDLSAGANVAVSDASSLDVRFANKRDILQTPFATTDVDAAYSFRTRRGLALRAGIGLNSYTDETSDLNDYSRVNLKAGLDMPLGETAVLNAEYAFLQNSFANNAGNNYGDHQLVATARLRPGTRAEYVFRLRSSFETGKSDFYNFSNLEPSIAVTTRRANSQLTFKGMYESFQYPRLGLRSYGRAVFSLNGTTKGERGTLSYDLGATSKTFSGNKPQNYVQVRGRIQSTRSGESSSSLGASFYTNLYSNTSANSFTEVRLDWNRATSRFFGDLSTYVRVWHSPGQPVAGKTGIVKPSVVDVMGKLGIVIKGFRIGPAFGLHALFSAEDEQFFKRDGNLFRFGASAEGTIALPLNGTLSLNGSYEYGFVYNNEVTINPSTGDVTEGDILTRHPTTLQANAAFSLPVLRIMDIIGRADFYIISTDMTSKLSINPIIRNDRFTFLVGVRLRYN